MNESEKLHDVVDEYLHWRKVNPHIKGGGNYLKRLRGALAETTNESDVKLREEFEKWALLDGYSVIQDGEGNYECKSCDDSWIAWQAATRHTDHLLEMAAEALKIAEWNFDADNITTRSYLRRIQQTLLTLQRHGYGKEWYE